MSDIRRCVSITNNKFLKIMILFWPYSGTSMETHTNIFVLVVIRLWSADLIKFAKSNVKLGSSTPGASMSSFFLDALRGKQCHPKSLGGMGQHLPRWPDLWKGRMSVATGASKSTKDGLESTRKNSAPPALPLNLIDNDAPMCDKSAACPKFILPTGLIPIQRTKEDNSVR